MKNLLLFLFSVLLFIGCKQDPKKNEIVEDVAEKVEIRSVENDGITLSTMESPKFMEATLKLRSPGSGSHLTTNQVAFEFDVEQYELGAQTGDAGVKLCANSAKGQHIHLIIDNGPYTAHYESSFEREIPDGRHLGLAFLSRSYHESIKTSGAYQLFHFSVGEAGDPIEFNTGEPHMFYSRPKGTYKGEDTKKILLDFYLVNTDLVRDGYTVRATVNGAEFIIKEWAPYTLEGLPMGENTIELALLDSTGELVPSPYNPVTRTIELEE